MLVIMKNIECDWLSYDFKYVADEHCLKIQTAEKSFIVVMESPDEQMAWLDYIRSAIQHSNMNCVYNQEISLDSCKNDL